MSGLLSYAQDSNGMLVQYQHTYYTHIEDGPKANSEKKTEDEGVQRSVEVYT